MTPHDQENRAVPASEALTEELEFLQEYAEELGMLSARGTLTWHPEVPSTSEQDAQSGSLGRLRSKDIFDDDEDEEPTAEAHLETRPTPELASPGESSISDYFTEASLADAEAPPPPSALGQIPTGAGHTIEAISTGAAGASPVVDHQPPTAEFDLQHIIGHGGQGQVWQGWQRRLLREVAVKRLTTGKAAEFLQEAYTAAELDHPNIIPIYDLVYDPALPDAPPLLAMKMVRGESWDRILRRERRGPEFNLDAFLVRHLRTFVEVCHAVAYAHAKGIIHRDLKPSQVMVGAYGEVYLTDWGLALYLLDQAPISELVGGPKIPLFKDAVGCAGSPAYMAPEQTRKSPDGLGIHTDIYLLGSILFELVEGAPPHMAPSATEALVSAMRNERKPLPEGCSPELRDIIERSLAREPTDRYSSAEELRGEVEDFLSGAGQVRESNRLTAEVEEQLRDGGTDSLSYADLAHLSQSLARALTLWPRNAEAARLKTRVNLIHARDALAAGDLMLADSLLAQVPEENETGSELREESKAHKRTLQRQARQRRVAVAATNILLVAIVAVGAFFLIRQRNFTSELQDALRKEAVAAERARTHIEQLRTERAGALDLMNYVLTDMQDRLSKTGQLDLLDQVTIRTLTYYRSLPTVDVDDDALRLRGLALRHLADIRIKQGNQAGAMEVYGQALAISRQLSDRSQATSDDRALVAAALHRIGDAYALQEGWDDANRNLHDAQQILKELAAEEPERNRWQIDLGGVEVSLANLNERRGDRRSALSMHEIALATRRSLAEAYPGDASIKADLAESLLAIGQLFGELGRAEEALAAIEEALLILMPVTNSDPGNTIWQVYLARARSGKAQLLAQAGKHSEALDSLRRGLMIWQRLVGLDPNRIDWQLSLARTQALAARLNLEMGDAQRALDVVHDAIPTLETQLVSPAAPVEFRFLRSALGRSEALALESLGKREKALEAMEASFKAYRVLFADPVHFGLDRDPLYDAAFQTARMQLAFENAYAARNTTEWAIRNADDVLRLKKSIVAVESSRRALGDYLYPMTVRLHLLEQETEAAFQRLEQAVEHGFRDRALLSRMQNFSLLQQQSPERLDDLLRRMSEPPPVAPE